MVQLYDRISVTDGNKINCDGVDVIPRARANRRVSRLTSRWGSIIADNPNSSLFASSPILVRPINGFYLKATRVFATKKLSEGVWSWTPWIPPKYAPEGQISPSSSYTLFYFGIFNVLKMVLQVFEKFFVNFES